MCEHDELDRVEYGTELVPVQYPTLARVNRIVNTGAGSTDEVERLSHFCFCLPRSSPLITVLKGSWRIVFPSRTVLLLCVKECPDWCVSAPLLRGAYVGSARLRLSLSLEYLLVWLDGDPS